MDINEIKYCSDKKPLLVLEPSSDLKGFVHISSKNEKQRRSIHLEMADEMALFPEGISEDEIWQACNDILERYAFHVAADVLGEIKDCLVDRERRDGLIREVEALYERSEIPETEKIVFDQQPKLNVSHKVHMDLQNIPGIIATEVRDRKLIIEISASSSNSKKLSSRIATCLKRNSTETEYKLQEYSVKPYTSYECGETLYAENGVKFGTLGWFFKSKENHIHAVLSLHVAQQLQSEKLVLRNKVIGKIPQILHEDPDIAIANVFMEFEAQCQTLFRDERFKFVPGKLWFKDVSSSVGQHVFIWGATSKPGKGRIESSQYFSHDMTYFIITDLTEAPFCKEGDSGAIVCAEQREGGYVYVLAIIIGKRQNQETPSQYLALPLKEGLEKLREVYKVEFSILGQSEI